MATYEDAHQLARQYKNAGVSRTELEALASRYETKASTALPPRSKPSPASDRTSPTGPQGAGVSGSKP
jgi:hypothetical protein